MPQQISGDEKIGWKLGGGSGSLRTKVCIQWYLGTEGNPREMCIRGDDHGEIKKKADETGLEAFVVEELLDAIPLTHIVLL